MWILEILKIVFDSALVAFSLFVVLDLLSRMIYSRSFMSTAAEIYLHFGGKNPTSEQAMEELRLRSKADDEPYSLPKGLKASVSMQTLDGYGMPTYVFNGEGKGVTVLYLHGGGYVRNPIVLHYKFAMKLAKRTDCRVVFPIYPKSPKYGFEDCYKALLPLCEKELFKRDEVIFMGDSSGGGLALGLYEWLKETGEKLPEKLVLFAPWVDLTMSNPLIPEYDKVDPRNSKSLADVWAKSWAKGADLKDYRLSPIYGDLALECEVHILVGTHDMLYPDCVALHEKLTERGTRSFLTVRKGLTHVYPIYPTPEGHAALRQVAKIVGRPQADAGQTVEA